MPEGGRNPKATLDQVTDAKHSNEALEKRKRFCGKKPQILKKKKQKLLQKDLILTLNSLKPTLQVICKMHECIPTFKLKTFLFPSYPVK